ncbi:MAG: hypothetical protein ABI634_13805 [Acidobacteriota bacterium]
MLSVVASACGDVNAALERLSEARRLSADLHVQFVKAAGATDRAVMADTDAASVDFAREAEEATQAAQHDVDALGPALQALKYADETRILQQFVGQFGRYQELERRILDLAVQNTNLKAQRLSFGPAADAADAFAAALDVVTPTNPTATGWSVAALSARAVAAVREIQTLQAPHIADPDDADMSKIEARMAGSEVEARSALKSLAPLVTTDSRSHLSAASAALDTFMSVNAQIVGLSRKNTNVRSLALSLDEKRQLTAPCDESLRTLENALMKRGYPRGR